MDYSKLQNGIYKESGFNNDLSGAGDKKPLNYKVFIASVCVFVLVIFTLFYFLNKNSTQIIQEPVDSITFPNIDDKNNDNNNGIGDTDQNDEDYEENERDDLIKIWDNEVLSFTIKNEIKNISQGNGTSTKVEQTIVRNILFFDLDSGFLYKATEPFFSPVKISKNSISNIKNSFYSSSFSRNGDLFAVISNNNLIIDTVGENENSNFNTNNIVDKNVFSVNRSLFNNDFVYTKLEPNNFLGIYIFNSSNTKITKAASIPLTNVKLQWVNTNQIDIYTLADSKTKQQIFTLNINTKSLTPKLDNLYNNKIDALGNVLFNDSTGLSYKNLNSGTSKTFNLNTFVDKCVEENLYYFLCAVPDLLFENKTEEWYKGQNSTRDTLFLINTKDITSKEIYPLSLISGESLDVDDVYYDSDLFVFKNKNNNNFWVLDLKNSYLR